MTREKLLLLPNQYKVYYVGQAKDVYQRYKGVCMNATMFYYEVNRDINAAETKLKNQFEESGVKLENIINPPKVPGNRDGYVYVLVEYSTDAVKSLNHKAIETCKGCGEKRREMEWTRNYCKKCSAKRKQANEQKEEKAARKKAKKSQGADQKPPPPPPATDTA